MSMVRQGAFEGRRLLLPRLGDIGHRSIIQKQRTSWTTTRSSHPLCGGLRSRAAAAAQGLLASPATPVLLLRLISVVATTALVGPASAAEEGGLPSRSYAIGDRAAEEIVTPYPLAVVDPARTEALREAEARKLPPIFRLTSLAAWRGEELLRTDFAVRRQGFVAALQARFRHAVPLLTVEASQPAFSTTVQSLREENRGFPLSQPLVELWAFGDSGDLILNSWVSRFRRMTNHLARPDVFPGGERLASTSLRLVAGEEEDVRISLATVESRGRTYALPDVPPVSRLREELVRTAGAGVGERELTSYVVGFLQANCVFDEELTRLARARGTESMRAADRFEAGQVLVRQGEVITPALKRALDELRVRRQADRSRAVAAADQVRREQVEQEIGAARRSAAASARMNRWLLAGLLAVGGLLVVVGWRSWRIRRVGLGTLESGEMSVLPATAGPLDEEAWRQRALLAEARADKATSLLRSSLLPHLARWMSNEVVQRLLLQRSEILTSQQKAEREVADLASRLDQLHAPLEDRLRAYEKRIAELEGELVVKGEQNADLIKARIESTRKRLEGERGEGSKDSLNWN